MACLCITGAGGHWLLIKTYDVAEASQVQPFAYFQLVFAAGLGMLVFGETLEWNVALGAAIVVAAGVFTLWRARVAELAQQPLGQADLRAIRRSAAPRRWRGFR
jgi:drug/metabolite transporter (DMT)-like permease